MQDFPPPKPQGRSCLRAINFLGSYLLGDLIWGVVPPVSLHPFHLPSVLRPVCPPFPFPGSHHGAGCWAWHLLKAHDRNPDTERSNDRKIRAKLRQLGSGLDGVHVPARPHTPAVISSGFCIALSCVHFPPVSILQGYGELFGLFKRYGLGLGIGPLFGPS